MNLAFPQSRQTDPMRGGGGRQVLLRNERFSPKWEGGNTVSEDFSSSTAILSGGGACNAIEAGRD